MGRRLKDALAQGKLVNVFGLGQLCHPKLVEIIGFEGGYDAVWLDQEHAGLSIQQIEEAARGARSAGLDSFVRLNPTDYASVMRPMEAGAGGIMAAQIRTLAQAKQVMEWAKFHPIGMRGFNATGYDGRYGTITPLEYARKSNDESFIALQVEHIDVVNDVEAIAALPGVDVLFVGPADLSQSMGILGQWDNPDLWKVIERVAKAAASAKIHWAILPMSPAGAKRCVDLGCKMLSVGMDTWTVQRGVRAFKKEYGVEG